MRSNGLSVKFIGLTSLFSQRQHSAPLQRMIKELPAFLRPCRVQLFHLGTIAALEPERQAGCIKDKHILLYEHNAFTSHLMLDSDEVYQMTKRGLDAAQISVAKRIHLNLVMVKLLELHHLGYDLRHYHAQHHAFIKQFNLPAHFQF